MTTQDARRAIYAAAFAIDTHLPPASSLTEDALDILDETLGALRAREGVFA